MDDLISRQAAIARAVPLNLFGREVMMVSVSELENLPSAQADVPDTNVGDLISRQAAIEAINRAMTKEVARWSVKELPSVEVEPVKRGKWMEMGTNADGTHNIKCDQCGEGFKTRGHARSYYTKNKYKFCPNCGAKILDSNLTQRKLF